MDDESRTDPVIAASWPIQRAAKRFVEQLHRRRSRRRNGDATRASVEGGHREFVFSREAQYDYGT
jgi:hypothetical protein